MNKRQVIQHAKDYLDLLAAGVDPISKEAVGGDTVASRPQIKKCFQFVSDILREVLENNGLVFLETGNDAPKTPASVAVTVNGNSFALVRKKAAFSISAEQRRAVFINRLPISPNEFLKNVNRTVNPDAMEKLSIKSVNAWLRKGGYIAEGKTQTVVNRTVWKPTRFAEEIGISEMDVPDGKTGEIKQQIMLSAQAQKFLLDHIDEIAAETK